MLTFVMLTRLEPDAVRSLRGFEELERDAMKRVRAGCADVARLNNYAVVGRATPSTFSSRVTSRPPRRYRLSS